MSENDNKVRVKLERHMWADEIEAKRRKRKTLTLVVTSIVLSLVVGVFVGRQIDRQITTVSSNPTENRMTKIDVISSIMSNNWYFASSIDDVETKILDQALYGMTSFDEDKHTTYMSSEEIESFTTSINMGFVGIGVQYTSLDGINVVEKIFKDSPAEKAGVLAGDIINKVDGIDIAGKTSTEIASMVKGEKGSEVVIEFLRQGEAVVLSIIRDEVNNTAFGYMLDEDTGYLEIYGFGNSTAEECKRYLEDMMNSNMKNLIIDLRDNGGGYLDALVDISSLFLEKNTVVMQQVFANGDVKESKTVGGNFVNVDDIVILINGNTASASEVLTMALLEKYPNTFTVGDVSYGKGTVQTTKYFSDGSAIKYTTSKWISPNGVWVNGEGIKPDFEVKLHDILYMSYQAMEDNEVYTLDSVSTFNETTQEALDFLGYKISRFDGYFDQITIDALNKFKEDYDLEKDSMLDQKTFETLVSAIKKEWSYNDSKDLQLEKAKELLNQ